jgi:hypothetical protein
MLTVINREHVFIDKLNELLPESAQEVRTPRVQCYGFGESGMIGIPLFGFGESGMIGMPLFGFGESGIIGIPLLGFGESGIIGMPLA